MSKKIISNIAPDGREVLSNILHEHTGKQLEYKQVTGVTDQDVLDGKNLIADVYIKRGSRYYIMSEYLDKGKLFLEKDSIAEVRSMSTSEILLLKIGYYKGVRVNGYYEKGDTPAPIEYFLSDTEEEDDGGSVLKISGIKLEYIFTESVDLRYYGASEEYMKDISSVLKHCSNKYKTILIPEGEFNLSDSITINNNNLTIKGLSKKSLLKFSENDDKGIEIIRSENVTLENFSINGNGGGRHNSGIVFAYNSPKFNASGLEIYNTGDLTNGISVHSDVDIRDNCPAGIFNNTIYNTGKSSIYLTTNNSIIFGNRCSGTGVDHESFTTPCIQVRQSKNVTVTNNNVSGATQAGIYVFNVEGFTEGSYFENIIISDNIINDCRIGILCEDSRQSVNQDNKDINNVIVSNNIITNNTDSSNSVGIELKNTNKVTLSTNSIKDNIEFGISISNSDNISIDSNSFHGIRRTLIRIGVGSTRGGKYFNIYNNTSNIEEEQTSTGLQLISALNAVLRNNIFNNTINPLSTNSVTNIISRLGNSFDYKETVSGSIQNNVKRSVNDTVIPVVANIGSYNGFTFIKEGTSSNSPLWSSGQDVSIGEYRRSSGNLYISLNAGITGSVNPVHTEGVESDGSIDWEYVDTVAESIRRGYYGYGLPYNTANTPVSPSVGYMFFNTTLNKPVWWNGANWVDSTGTAV